MNSKFPKSIEDFITLEIKKLPYKTSAMEDTMLRDCMRRMASHLLSVPEDVEKEIKRRAVEVWQEYCANSMEGKKPLVMFIDHYKLGAHECFLKGRNEGKNELNHEVVIPLLKQLAEKEKELEYLRSGTHTCHDECQKPICVKFREKDRELAESARLHGLSANREHKLVTEIAELKHQVEWMNKDKCVPCDERSKIESLTAQLKIAVKVIDTIDHALNERDLSKIHLHDLVNAAKSEIQSIREQEGELR